MHMAPAQELTDTWEGADKKEGRKYLLGKWY